MKTAGVLFLLINILFASAPYIKISPVLTISGALNGRISGMDFDNKTFIVYSNTEIVARNVNKKPVKFIRQKAVKKAEIFEGKIYVSTHGKKNLKIFSVNKTSVPEVFPLSFQPDDFLFVNGFLYVLHHDKITIYSPASKNMINNIYLSFSASKMFETYNKDTYIVKQYDYYLDILKNDEIFNKLSYAGRLTDANIVNNVVFKAETDRNEKKTFFKIYELDTLQKLHSFEIKEQIISAQISKNRRYIFYTTVDANRVYLFDVMKQRTEFYFPVKYKQAKIKLSPDNRLIGVYYPNGIYDIYDISGIKNILPDSYANNEQLEFTLNSESSDKKPVLKISLSAKKGFSPLKTVFTVITDPNEKIIGYYVNFGNGEILKNGRPPLKIRHTYSKPGVYHVLIAVKNAAGYVTQKTLKVTVKEETFEDFKKTYGY